jgi:hypothetical protein
MLKIRPCGRSFIDMCSFMSSVGDFQTREGKGRVEQQKDGTIYPVPAFGANLAGTGKNGIPSLCTKVQSRCPAASWRRSVTTPRRHQRYLRISQLWPSVHQNHLDGSALGIIKSLGCRRLVFELLGCLGILLLVVWQELSSLGTTSLSCAALSRLAS